MLQRRLEPLCFSTFGSRKKRSPVRENLLHCYDHCSRAQAIEQAAAQELAPISVKVTDERQTQTRTPQGFRVYVRTAGRENDVRKQCTANTANAILGVVQATWYVRCYSSCRSPSKLNPSNRSPHFGSCVCHRVVCQKKTLMWQVPAILPKEQHNDYQKNTTSPIVHSAMITKFMIRLCLPV